MGRPQKTKAEMQTAFLEDGFLICEGFASAQECAGMIAQANELIASFDETAHQVVFRIWPVSRRIRLFYGLSQPN